MKKQIVSSLAEPVGMLWKKLQEKYTSEGSFSVASPLSSTPLPIYQWIIEHAEEFANWNKVRFVLMDEILEGSRPPFTYISTDDPASYEGFARKHLLLPLSKKVSVSIEVAKPDLSNIQDFRQEIDLLLLAIGIQGNYANVMPGTSEEIGWHTTYLSSEFRQYHTQKGSQSYEGARFREYGMSLGPQQILDAKNVVVIISGKRKQNLARQLLTYNMFDPAFPLSIIYHPKVKDRVSLYMTRDAV